jgi:elongation factor P hydroxylase
MLKIFVLLSLFFLIKYANLMNQTELNQYWTQFKINFNKTYENSTIESERKLIFATTLSNINEQNIKFNKGLISYSSAINQFSDWVIFIFYLIYFKKY